ncbi:hypothetical protein CCAL12920_08325 [Campylobacter sp. RM12920]|uniref:DUF5675 domain-containing protein n=1 Tax=Campylobacter californiensis TaxID=1032243 RepID=A0ABD4JJ60_9BACT|nr:hypothetical protein [Campylobacter sp. RM12919]MBE2988883.1 hypothetical protein [Campylobacter sp. RM12920]
MKTLYIKRFKAINDGTIGEFKLVQDSEVLLSGYTLEPAGPDTVTPNNDRRIPAGAYTATWSYSSTFKKELPLLFSEMVSKNRRILIHGGNYPKDTLGCVLIGAEYNERGVLKSTNVLNELINLTRDSDFQAIIANNKGA